MQLLVEASVVLLAYVLGSIPFGLLIVKISTGKDIRDVASGRTGGTNAGRAAGTWAGILTGLLDGAKGAVAGVFTADKSCTVPPVSNNPAAPSEFVNYAYAGDLAGDGLDAPHPGRG